MSRKNHTRALEESCAWIRENWNAMNLDVPDALLGRWIFEQDDEQEAPNGFHLAVFTFGFLQHDLICRHVPTGAQRSVSLSELLDLFQRWQLKLGLAEMHRRTPLRIKPLPLFAFPENEGVEVWEDGPSFGTV